jgi:hypothetical protein
MSMIARAYDPGELIRAAAETARDQSCAAYPPPGCSPLVDLIATEFPAGFRETFGADAFRVDPRIGFAFRLGSGRVAVWGGWGRYSGQFPAIIVTESQVTPNGGFARVSVVPVQKPGDVPELLPAQVPRPPYFSVVRKLEGVGKFELPLFAG